MIKKLRSCKVETHFLSERENHRLKVLFSSDGDRISHVSCISELIVSYAVYARYAVMSAHILYGNQGGITGFTRPF